MTGLTESQLRQLIAGLDPLPVGVWRDPVVESLGVAWDDPYVETFWLSSLGPSALWCYRRLVRSALAGVRDVPLAALAGELGLSGATGANSPIVRTLHRLVLFGPAQVWPDRLEVRLALPRLARRHLHRLPLHLAEAHRLTEVVSA